MMRKNIVAAALKQLSQQKPDVTAINIGAFDGKSNDPLYEFIIENQWRAVLVEPNPTSFATLQQTFEDIDHVALENIAIADTDGTMDFLVPVLTGNEPKWFPQTASLSEEAMQQSIRLIQQEHKGTGKYTDQPQIERIPVQTLTPQSLLASTILSILTHSISMLKGMISQFYDRLILVRIVRLSSYMNIIH